MITGLDQNYMKTLHVSPFNQIEGHYRFSFSNSENQVKSSIEYFVNSKVLLFASITGKAKEFTSLNLFFTFLIYPIHNLAAIFFIHYEALFLYLKKIPFHGKQGVKHDHTT